MKNIILLFALLMLFCFASCKDNLSQSQNGILWEPITAYDYDETVECEDVVDGYYVVTTNEDFTYNFRVCDINGNGLITIENCPRCPQFAMVGDDIVSVTLQMGTGRSTNIVRYCNIETGKVSDAYQYVVGEIDDCVIYVDFDEDSGWGAVVSKMFDGKAEIIRVPLEDVCTNDPVVSEIISDDAVELVYLKGKDYIETKIKIDIKN